MKKLFLLTLFAVLTCFGVNRAFATQYIVLDGGVKPLTLSYNGTLDFNANLPGGWEFLDYNVTTRLDWTSGIFNIGAHDTDIEVEPLLPPGSGKVIIKYVGSAFGDYSSRGYTVEIRTCQQGNPSIPLTTTLHVTVEGYPVIPEP